MLEKIKVADQLHDDLKKKVLDVEKNRVKAECYKLGAVGNDTTAEQWGEELAESL